MAIRMTDEERVELYSIVNSIIASERLKVVRTIMNGHIRPLMDEIFSEAEWDHIRADDKSWEKLGELTGLLEGADKPARRK